MKALTLFLLLFSCTISAQKTATNDPVVAKKLLDQFVEDAEIRGIEVRERLYTINKIILKPGAKNEHWHSGGICTITLDSNLDEYDILFRGYHEIGHHFGLNHCILCSYNIMTEIRSGKTYIFKDKPIREIYLDVYFEAIRNPKKYNEGHTHY